MDGVGYSVPTVGTAADEGWEGPFWISKVIIQTLGRGAYGTKGAKELGSGPAVAREDGRVLWLPCLLRTRCWGNTLRQCTRTPICQVKR